MTSKNPKPLTRPRKGEPNYDECLAFFGEGSRVCNIYKEAGHAAAPSDQNEKAKP